MTDTPLADFCRDHLGPIEVTGDDQRPSGGRILHVRTRRGERYVAKQHATLEKYERETTAYRTWLPAVRANVAELVARTPELPAVLLTYLKGDEASHVRPGSLREELTHERAGAFLARLHQATPTGGDPNLGQALAERMTVRIPALAAAGALPREHSAALDACMEHLRRTDDLEAGVCHLDFTPQNWLIQPHGAVGVVDFEHCRRDAVARDLCRLAFRVWPHRPHLRAAFARGYGQANLHRRARQLPLFTAIEAVTALSHGHRHNDLAMIEMGRDLLRNLPNSSDILG